MKKIIIALFICVMLSSCVSEARWTITRKIVTLTQSAKIAYIMSNDAFDNFIVIGLRNKGLANIKKFKANTSIPDEYSYILTSNIYVTSVKPSGTSYKQLMDPTTKSNAYSSIQMIKYKLADHSGEVIVLAEFFCDYADSQAITDSYCLDNSITEFARKLFEEAAKKNID